MNAITLKSIVYCVLSALMVAAAEARAEFTKDPAAEFRFYRLKAEVTE